MASHKVKVAPFIKLKLNLSFHPKKVAPFIKLKLFPFSSNRPKIVKGNDRQ